VASNGSGGTFHVLVNGVNVTGVITVPNTGAWQTWTTLTKTGVSLSAGQQVVRVVLDTRGVTGSVCNLNWIRVTAATPTPPTVSASLTAPTSGATYTAPASITVSANATTTSGSISKVDFYAGTTVIGISTTSPYSIPWTNVAAGTYSLSARATTSGG